MSCFAFAVIAFGARLIVAMRVGCLAGKKNIARPNEDIDRPKKAKRLTVKPKIAADMA